MRDKICCAKTFSIENRVVSVPLQKLKNKIAFSSILHTFLFGLLFHILKATFNHLKQPEKWRFELYNVSVCFVARIIPVVFNDCATNKAASRRQIQRILHSIRSGIFVVVVFGKRSKKNTFLSLRVSIRFVYFFSGLLKRNVAKESGKSQNKD